MITPIEVPTQLKPLFESYDETIGVSRDEFEATLRKSIIDKDYVTIADKNGNRVYGFIVAKVSTLRNRQCGEVLIAYSRNDDRGIWGGLVKAILKWADGRGIDDVYVLRNLRRR